MSYARVVQIATTVVGLTVASAMAQKNQVTLVTDGSAKSAIYVDSAVMADDATLKPTAGATAVSWEDQQHEEQRRSLRESVRDLKKYLDKISGAEVEIVTGEPADDDKRLPILIGRLANDQFGPPSIEFPFGQAFRFTVTAQGIGLGGASDLGTSYAVYELLERLGCRWYMPSELGEVVPTNATLTLRVADESLSPGTISRRVAYADDDFQRRTRQGGPNIRAEHALEIRKYVSDEQLEANPLWCALVNGERTTRRFCWANDDLTNAVADGIIAVLDKSYKPSISLSPNDGLGFCECDLCKALDANDVDPSMGEVSITDRYINFCNRVAERVTEKYPDVRLGLLAYVNYTRPPVRETPHPNLVPIIAPITYCRAHTILQEEACPSRPAIRQLVEGWGQSTEELGYYAYLFHLAEVTAPYPMIRQLSDELPVLYANNIRHWVPETMPIYDSVLPGMTLAIRMSWDKDASPGSLLDEFYVNYYGPAAEPMRRYWETFDKAWTGVPEHAGSGFGYARRFTPDVMHQVRAAMDESLAASQDETYRGRVRMHDESLRQFEAFMQLRWDLFQGRLENLAADGDLYLKRQIELGKKYEAQYSFSKTFWTPKTIGGHYFSAFFKQAYDGASPIARNHKIIGSPLRNWRYQVDKDEQGEKLGWHTPEADDQAWQTTDPCVDTWYALGLADYFGTVFYRTTATMPAPTPGKRQYLWLSATDGSAKVFVNGKHVPHLADDGSTKEESSGFCAPATFDVTSAIQADGDQQITIIAKRLFLNELGTGGLIGPAYLYSD